MDGTRCEQAEVRPVVLRMLVADENSETLGRMAELGRKLGHEVVAHELAPTGVARAVRGVDGGRVGRVAGEARAGAGGE